MCSSSSLLSRVLLSLEQNTEASEGLHVGRQITIISLQHRPCHDDSNHATFNRHDISLS